jgi:hypothetical protein
MANDNEIGRKVVRSFFNVARDVVTGKHATHPIHQQVSRGVRAVANKCRCCDEVMLIPITCSLCGKPYCEVHMFMNADGIGFCVDCAAAHGIEIEFEDEPEERDASQEFPWVDLGIDPTTDQQAIKQAFREKASACHPDHGGDTGTFQRVKSAYDEALSWAKENG